MRLRRMMAGCLAVAAAAVVSAVAVSGEAATQEGGVAARAVVDRERDAGAAPRTVTLVTGDRVTVVGAEAGADGMTVERGPGRAGMGFVTSEVGGHLEVVPLDAVPLLGAGRLDRRLFDVTALLEGGYDRRAEVPLIVTYAPGAARAAAGTVTTSGARVARELPRIGGVAARVKRSEATRAWNALTAPAGGKRTLHPGLGKVWLDGVRKPVLERSVPQIGAPDAWQAGYTGAGVTVAVLDSGIDDTHPDLVGRVDARRNFTTDSDLPEDDLDHTGHGTHVASTIAGSGAASAGTRRGAAPDARLLDAKVCGLEGCAESAILAGLEWAAAERRAAVVNLSLGGTDTPDLDPLEAAVNTLTNQYGTLFVVSAGNRGAHATVGSPGSADAALTVGAVDSAGALADFSSRGPRVGDHALKPDLTAPGVDITAARGKDAEYIGGSPGDAYAASSGTSMATPHVAAAAALLRQRHPDWAATQLKAALIGTARPNPATGPYAQGAGLVDVAAAVEQTTTAAPASVSFTHQLWPHTDNPADQKTVTYTNHAPTPITMNLTITATGPHRAPVPNTMFTVTPTTVTMPAGGQATATLTADTRIGPTGMTGGRLTATPTGTGRPVHVPFAVDKEVESHDVTLVHTDRAGRPALWYSTGLVDRDTGALFSVRGDGSAGDGVERLRVPRGRYSFTGWVAESDPEDPQSAVSVLNQPAVELTGARTIEVDAREARPIAITLPHPTARSFHAEINLVTRARNGARGGFRLFDTDFGRFFTGRLGPDARVNEIGMRVTGKWAEPGADGRFHNSPYAYNLAWHRSGQVFHGLDRRVTGSDVASVRTQFAAQLPESIIETRVSDAGPVAPGSVLLTRLTFSAPFTQTAYFNADGPVRWSRSIGETTAAGAELGQLGLLTRYTPGRSYREVWNTPVFGPVLVGADDNGPASVYREHTEISGQGFVVDAALVGDAAGHVGRRRQPGTVRAALYRDDTLIGETTIVRGVARFPVPPADSQYRLEAQARHELPGVLSTDVRVAWTFRSKGIDLGDSATLPLWVVRFAPRLETGAAPAGREFPVPVSVRPQPGSPVGRNRSLTVEVSYDDGQHWTVAPLREGDQGRSAVLRHPDTGGHVSLRATAADSAGNTVTQTIVRAYRIEPRG